MQRTYTSPLNSFSITYQIGFSSVISYPYDFICCQFLLILNFALPMSAYFLLIQTAYYIFRSYNIFYKYLFIFLSCIDLSLSSSASSFSNLSIHRSNQYPFIPGFMPSLFYFGIPPCVSRIVG